jgi:hypothetical protein
MYRRANEIRVRVGKVSGFCHGIKGGSPLTTCDSPVSASPANRLAFAFNLLGVWAAKPEFHFRAYSRRQPPCPLQLADPSNEIVSGDSTILGPTVNLNERGTKYTKRHP